MSESLVMAVGRRLGRQTMATLPQLRVLRVSLIVDIDFIVSENGSVISVESTPIGGGMIGGLAGYFGGDWIADFIYED